MTANLRLSPVNAGLVLLMLLAGGLLLRDLGKMREPEAPAPSADAIAAGEAGAAAAQAGLDQFREIAERPLFAPSRRAQPAQAAIAAAPTAAKPPNFELAGIVAAGNERFVLVRPQGGKLQRLIPGQKLGDWQLVAIGSDRATFANGSMRSDLPLARRAATNPNSMNDPRLVPQPNAH